LRSLVDREGDGENNEIPALHWKQIAARMNDYIAKNGHISDNGRAYNEATVHLRWKCSQENLPNVDADADEITEEQFTYSSSR
jgi:hypothetical protein